jgi:hypothetical protein
MDTRDLEQLDSLCSRWRAALDAAGRALSAAGGVVPPDRLRGRASRLSAERVTAVLALESLARDRHVVGWHATLRVRT